MYKTILCAIEASKEGEEVLAKAVQFSKMLQAKLIVINVIPYSVLPKNYQKELEENISKKMEMIMARFDIPKKSQMIKIGKPYEIICAQAEKKKADLIFIGTHSKKGLKSLLGSTANGVANYAKCDVNLVKI